MAPLVLVLVMVPEAFWATAPVPVMVMFPVVELFVMGPSRVMEVPVHVMEPPVVAFVRAALKVIPALAVTVSVLVVVAVQLRGLLRVTVPEPEPPEAVVMVTLQVERFVRRFAILTLAVVGLVPRV